MKRVALRNAGDEHPTRIRTDRRDCGEIVRVNRLSNPDPEVFWPRLWQQHRRHGVGTPSRAVPYPHSKWRIIPELGIVLHSLSLIRHC
jgi:hypothetical protein